MPDQTGTNFTCHSCASSLQFKSADSYCLVCPACQAVNYRPYQITIPDLKKLEPAQEDMSVIRLGTKGVYQDTPFEVIGRLQYFFQERYRNHWFLMYANGATGWLGDWDGNYSWLSRLAVVRSKFENPVPGKKVQINNEEYLTEQIDVSRKFFGEGELGDFYLNADKFVTIELYTTEEALALANIFTDKKVEALTGHYVDLNLLNLQDLRQYHDWV
jgi:hypothetical protein